MNDNEKNAADLWEIQNSTQAISLFVGGLLIFLGLWGIFFTGFAGLHMGVAYGLLVTCAGGILFYFGHTNNSWAAFITCLLFGLAFAALAIAGIMNVQQGYEQGGIFIIPNYREQGNIDYLLNIVLSVVLFGGAIDWFRRYRVQRKVQPKEKKHLSGRLVRH